MAEFDTAHVRNIVLLGHAGSGKTTLAECMLYEAGAISRKGSIRLQNTVGDCFELERERGNTIFSKLMHARWRGYKINIIDTPGSIDFVGEVISALRVADTGILLLDAMMGVEVGSDTIFEYTEQFKTPLILVVNKLDDDNADYDRVVAEAKNHFGTKVVIIQYPLQQGAGFHEIVDLLTMTLYKFPDTGGKPEKLPIPLSEQSKADRLHKELVEAIAGNDELLMEKYFERGELDEEDLKAGMKQAMINHELFPLFCLSAERNMGSGRLMGFIDVVCASANEMPPQVTTNGKPRPCEQDGPPCIFIFKTLSEPHIGELSFFKVFSGTIRSGIELVNASTGTSEKLNQLFIVEGNKRQNVNELTAGDIGATLRLKNTHVNNTLHHRSQSIDLPPIVFPPPNLTVAIESVRAGEEEKLSEALHQLREEDPTIIVEFSSELHQTIIHCQGDMHLAVIKWKIEHYHKSEVRFVKPKIPYRETIRNKAESSWRHKKQSGGAGQFAEVSLRIDPYTSNMTDPNGLTVRNRDLHELPWGGTLAFYNCIVGGAIDNRFLPSILKGIMEKMQSAPLTGSYARDVRVCVFDGKMHPVDSNDISFKIAGMKAFKQAFLQADPQVLEPIYNLEIHCPDEITGIVIGDLQTRRAMVEGLDTAGHFTKVMAKAPLAELHNYASSLRSLSQGRAKFLMRFSDYIQTPTEVQRKLMEDYKQLAGGVEQ